MTVRVTAEWALWGKRPGTRDGDEILACSQGLFSRDDFGEIMSRYALGTLADLPQVTFSWVGGGLSAHLGMAVQEWSDQRDGLGRDIAVTRYCCVPYAQIAKGPVSYAELHRALGGRVLPVDGPLTVDVPPLDLESAAGAVDETVIGAAALLLTGAPVCVLNGENVPLADRLTFLDAVASLLPYGFRAKLTASTWTNSATRHRIRLSFARHAPAGAHSISWGRPARPSDGQDIAQRFYDTLTKRDKLSELVADFARRTEPKSMTAEDLSGILTLVGEHGAPPRPEQPATRTRRLQPGDPEIEIQRHFAVLAAEYGTVIDRPALEEIVLSWPERPPAPLLAALALLCAPDARRLLIESVFLSLLRQDGIAPVTLDRIRGELGDSARGGHH